MSLFSTPSYHRAFLNYPYLLPLCHSHSQLIKKQNVNVSFNLAQFHQARTLRPRVSNFTKYNQHKRPSGLCISPSSLPLCLLLPLLSLCSLNLLLPHSLPVPLLLTAALTKAKEGALHLQLRGGVVVGATGCLSPSPFPLQKDFCSGGLELVVVGWVRRRQGQTAAACLLPDRASTATSCCEVQELAGKVWR